MASRSVITSLLLFLVPVIPIYSLLSLLLLLEVRLILFLKEQISVSLNFFTVFKHHLFLLLSILISFPVHFHLIWFFFF